MPQIPQYESRVRVTTEAAPVAGIAMMQGVNEGMKVFAEIDAKVKAMRDYAQESDAKLKAAQGMAALEDKLNNTPDTEFDPDKQAQEIDEGLRKIGEEAYANVSDPQARMRMKNAYSIHAIGVGQDLKNSVRKRQIDIYNASVVRDNELDKDAYYNTPDPAAKQQILNGMVGRIDQQVAMGTITRAQGEEHKIKLTRDAYEGQVDNDINTDPQYALTELQRGEFGAYGQVPADIRQKKVEDAKKELSKQKTQQEIGFREARNKREDDIIIDGGKTITDQMIQQDMDSGAIDARFGRAELERRKNAIPNEKTLRFASPKVVKERLNKRGKTFNGIVENIIEQGMSDEDLKLAVTKAAGQREITNDDANVLFSFRNLLNQENKSRQTDPGNGVLGQLKRLFNLKDVHNLSDEEAYEMFNNFINSVDKGEKPEEAAYKIGSKVLNTQMDNTQNKIRVKRKSDGKEGTVSSQYFNPELYDKL